MCVPQWLYPPRRAVAGAFAGMGGRGHGVLAFLRCVLSIVRKAEGCEGPGAEPGAECELTLCTGKRGAGQGAPAPGGEDECGGIRGAAPESPGGRHGHRPSPGECQRLCGAEVVPPGSVCWAPTSGVVNLCGLSFQVAEYLTSQFYAVNYSLRQRMDILDVSAPGSLSHVSGPCCPNAGARPGTKPRRGSRCLPKSLWPLACLLLDLRGWDQCLSDQKAGNSDTCYIVGEPGARDAQ